VIRSQLEQARRPFAGATGAEATQLLDARSVVWLRSSLIYFTVHS
jgi:alpha-D-ribose 1-methylphosphonate 5-triphosphate synthase subunit PhnH